MEFSEVSMSPSLWAVVATILLAMLQIGMQSVATLVQAGPRWVAGYRDEPFHVKGLAGRIVRAHRNLLEIIPQFFAAVIVIHLSGLEGTLSHLGAWVFVGARLVYVPAYVFGPVGLRPGCWLIAQSGIVLILADLVW